MVIELKVKPADGSRGETPMKALVEGLRYAAIIQANREVIAEEAKTCFHKEISAEPPTCATACAAGLGGKAG